MSEELHAIEAAAGAAISPYSIYLKLAAWAIGACLLIGVGWALHDAFDGTKAAKAETAVAQCQKQDEANRADLNGAAAVSIAKDSSAAAGADRGTNAKETPRKSGYAAAQQEASHVPQDPKPAVCIDPEPLRQLFIGMRKADAAAGAGSTDRGAASDAAQHDLPEPAADQ